MNRTLQIWNDLRPFSVGFDNLFEHFDMHLAHQKVQTFPPYNIKKIDEFNWQIEMALAGFGKNDISVETANGQLKIQSVEFIPKTKQEKSYSDLLDKYENEPFVHRGISKRKFTKQFTLADDVVVNAAELKDGMLLIDVEKIVPDEKKPRTIKIK